MITENKRLHNTWIEIDSERLMQNLEVVRQHVSSQTNVMAVVKANAYGHGMCKVARMLSSKVDFFGVSCFAEADELRSAGILSPLLILGSVLPEDMPPAAHEDISFSVSGYDYAYKLHELGLRSGMPVKVHVKVDTGMGRWGVPYTEAYEVVKRMRKLDGLSLEGMFTHFSVADDPRIDYTERQIELFSLLVDELHTAGIDFEYVHAANSAAILNYPRSHYSMVRPGIVLYGYSPLPADEDELGLKPCLSLRSRVALIKEFPANRGVSYGRKFVTPARTRIAVVPVGYSHGYLHSLSGKARVLINGKSYPVAGNICMDYCMVDLGTDCAVKVGDNVTLLGEDAQEKITAHELASLAGTIPYEIITNLSNRIPRVYSEEG